jgi:hypothetical protein
MLISYLTSLLTTPEVNGAVDLRVMTEIALLTQSSLRFHVNLLHPSGFFLYIPPGLTFKILHGARFALSVLFGPLNRHRPLLNGFYNRDGKCLQRDTD